MAAKKSMDVQTITVHTRPSPVHARHKAVLFEGLTRPDCGKGGGGVGKAAEGVRRAASLSSDLGCVLARSCGFQVASLSSPLPEYSAEMLGRWQVAEIRAQLPPGVPR